MNGDPVLNHVQYQRMKTVFNIIAHNTDLRSLFLGMRGNDNDYRTAGRLIQGANMNQYASLPAPPNTPLERWTNNADQRSHRILRSPAAAFPPNSWTS